MKKVFFGTDGIRGTANEFPIIPSFLYDLAVAIAKSKKKKCNVLIARDTRVSGEMIEKSIISGFKSVGTNCDSLGIVSTPMLSFFTKSLKYDFGIMISASHNPYQDNGIKIFKTNGEKLSDNEELKIERRIKHLPNSNKKFFGKINRKKIDFSEYQKFILSCLPSKIDLKKFPIFIDCANGSLSKIAPKIFKELGAKVTVYGCKPNGKNINKNCGALYPDKLSSLTIKNNAKIGLSFDGDADRVIISDEKGNIFDGDTLLSIIASYLNCNGFLKNKSLVTTFMSNLGFRKFVEDSGIKLFLTKVGDRYVVEKMKKTNSILGGEQSGHVIFSKNGFCGDGILTSLFVLSISINRKCKLSTLGKLFKKTPQKLVNLKLQSDSSLIEKNKNLKKIVNNFLSSHKGECDILIRRSGTENLLRVMVQSKKKSTLDKVMSGLLCKIKKLDNG